MNKNYLLRVMRLLVFFLMVGFLQLSAAGFSQTITLKGNDLPMKEVFEAIYQQAGYGIAGSEGSLDGARPVSVDVRNMPVDEFLKQILANQPFTFRVVGKTIVLLKKPTVSLSMPKSAMMQDSLIFMQGTVTDDEGKPMEGVTITSDHPIKVPSGQNAMQFRGWTTSKTGNFTLICPAGTKLTFSSLGFEKTVVEAKKGTVNVQMEKAVSELEDVVVTGIYTRKAESFTGSAQTYNKDDLLRVGNMNVLQSLKNLDPSFNIVQNLSVGSNPNALPQIQLRGQSGFPDLKGEYQTDPNQPLFILDGFETSLTRIIDLDMNRVKSITLLKDAAAKAMYGSKAANGVVVIETERPKEGKIRLTYTGNLNVSAPDLSSYHLTNAAQKLQVEREAGLYVALNAQDANGQYAYDANYNEILEEVLKGVNTDWLSQPVRTGIGQKHTLYAEGGTESLQYGVDFSYNDVAGVMKGSDRQTTSGGITLAYRAKNFSVRNNLAAVYNKGINSPYGSFGEYASMNPYFRPTDDLGRITKVAGQTLVTGVVANPLWNTTINTKDYDQYTQLLNNFYAEWLVNSSWKLTGRASIMRQENGSEQFYPASHTKFITYTTDDLVNRKGQYTHGDGYNTDMNADVMASFSKNMGKHFLTANADWSISNSTARSLTVIAEGFPNDFMDDITFARQYQQDTRPTGSESTIRDIGVLGAVSYSYDDRYLLDASYRMSASSQFGNDNRWGKFWSAGLGWNVHQETFAKDWTFLDQLRIRGSLGYTGSQNFNSYQAKTTFTYNTLDTYLGNYGAYLLSLGNPALKWQRKFDQDAGVDLSLWQRRLMLRVDYYTSTTNDLLTDVSIPSSIGFTSYKENLGEVQNKGYEFNVNYRFWNEMSSGNFMNIYVAGSHNENRIRKISNSLAAYNEAQSQVFDNKPMVRYTEGQSMSAIWAVPSYGIDPATGRELYIARDGTITNTWNSDDLAVVGDTEPTLRGNAGITMSYNGWNLNVGINWKFGGQLYNQTVVDKVENADLKKNVDERIFTDRWRAPGDVTWFKSIKNHAFTTQATQRFIEDQNEWTLSTVNLSYDLDRLAAIKRARLSRLRVSLYMTDVATVSSIRIERGTDYPFAREFSLAVQATF